MPLPDAPAKISHSMIMAEFGHPVNTQWSMSADGAAYINFTVGSIIKESDFYSASGSSGGSQLEVATDTGSRMMSPWLQETPADSAVMYPNARLYVAGDGRNGRTVIFQTQWNGNFTSRGHITQLKVTFNTSADPVTMQMTADQNHNGTVGSPLTAGGSNPDYSYNQMQTWFTQDAPSNATSMNLIEYQESDKNTQSGGTCIAPICAYGVQSGLTPSDTRGSGTQSTSSSGSDSIATQNIRPLNTPGAGLVTGIFHYEVLNAGSWETQSSGFKNYPNDRDRFIERHIHSSDGTGSGVQDVGYYLGQYYSIGTPRQLRTNVEFEFNHVGRSGGLHLAWFPQA